jgi:hypothetical protein
MRTDVAPVAVADSLPFGCHCSCVISAWPTQTVTSDTGFIPAVPVAEKTAYTVVWVIVVEPCTGLFAADDPVNNEDPSGHDGETIDTLIDDSFSITLGTVSKGSQGLLAQAAPTRPLTSGEISLAQTVFGSTINYSITCIHLTRYSPLISVDTFVTPDGTMYMDPSAEAYSSDFSKDTASQAYDQSIFIHELTHVWQHQHGVHVVLAKLLHPSEKDYDVDFSAFGTKTFTDFNIEQQGMIVQDYFLESHWGWGGYNQKEADGSTTTIHFPPLGSFKKELKPYFPLGQ